MRSFFPSTMSRPLPLLRSCLLLACVAALLHGCGGAGAPGPKGNFGVHDQPGPPPPPEEAAPSFMRVGSFEQPSERLATVAPTAAPEAPPPSGGDLKTGELSQPMATNPHRPADKLNVDEKQKDSGRVEGAVVDSQGGLSEADVRAAIAGKQASFRRCYDMGISSAPDFAGSVMLRVSISPAGNVASAEVVSSSTRNTFVDACVRDEVRTLLFKASGIGAVVAFPLEFGR